MGGVWNLCVNRLVIVAIQWDISFQSHTIFPWTSVWCLTFHRLIYRLAKYNQFLRTLLEKIFSLMDNFTAPSWIRLLPYNSLELFINMTPGSHIKMLIHNVQHVQKQDRDVLYSCTVLIFMAARVQLLYILNETWESWDVFIRFHQVKAFDNYSVITQYIYSNFIAVTLLQHLQP